MGAVLAACDVPAEGCRAAALDGIHHLELVEAHMTAVGVTPCGPVAAEDVRDLQRWPRHDSGALRRRSLVRQGQIVERAGDRSQQVGGNMGIV